VESLGGDEPRDYSREVFKLALYGVVVSGGGSVSRCRVFHFFQGPAIGGDVALGGFASWRRPFGNASGAGCAGERAETACRAAGGEGRRYFLPSAPRGALRRYHDNDGGGDGEEEGGGGSGHQKSLKTPYIGVMMMMMKEGGIGGEGFSPPEGSSVALIPNQVGSISA